MHRIMLGAVLLALVVGSSARADQAQRGVYVGGGIGLGHVTLDESAGGPDDDDTAYKLFVGYRSANFFAIEGGYRDLGQVANESARSATSGWDAAGVGILKLGHWDAFGKIGIVRADTDAVVRGQPVGDTDTGTLWGVGVAARFKRLRGLAVRLEYEVLDVRVPDDLQMISFGATFTF